MLVSALEFLDSLNKIMFSKINILCKVWPSFFRWYVCWLQQLPPSEGLSELWWREALFWFSLIKALQARKTMWKIKIEKLEPISAEVRDGEMSARMEWKWRTASMDVNECCCPHMAKVLPFCCTVSSYANLLQMEQLSPLRRLQLQGHYPLCRISRGQGEEKGRWHFCMLGNERKSLAFWSWPWWNHGSCHAGYHHILGTAFHNWSKWICPSLDITEQHRSCGITYIQEMTDIVLLIFQGQNSTLNKNPRTFSDFF